MVLMGASNAEAIIEAEDHARVLSRNRGAVAVVGLGTQIGRLASIEYHE